MLSSLLPTSLRPQTLKYLCRSTSRTDNQRRCLFMRSLKAKHSMAVSRRPCCTVALRRTAWSEHGMTSVNQTRPHCVNQMGKANSKTLAARHGRGTVWARHAMCESVFRVLGRVVRMEWKWKVKTKSHISIIELSQVFFAFIQMFFNVYAQSDHVTHLERD